MSRAATLVLCLLLLQPCAARDAADPGAAAATPAWALDGTLRLRSEYLNESFRIVAPRTDMLLLSRLELSARYESPAWSMQFEIQDSRAWWDERFSPIGTDDVNAVEPVNVNVTRRWRPAPQRQVALKVGRMTIDHGSRRLLARNRFRNTSNAFQGLHVEHTSPGVRSTALYSYALQRRPNPLQPGELDDNRFSLDRAGQDERFWGLTHERSALGGRQGLGLYIFGSRQRGSPSRPVRPRDLLTAGFRHQGERDALSWEIEAAYQWGDASDSALADARPDLKHRAWFTHLHVGYAAAPGLTLQLAYDQATGDRDPGDGRFERFDRLYGARAFELGPSGVFGAGLRSNLRAPALRAVWQPAADRRLLLSVRALQLDSATDIYAPGARRDRSGSSGRDIGTQWEARWRWQPGGSGFSLEMGAAILDQGRFFRNTTGNPPLNPAAGSSAASRYAYLQVTRAF